MPYIDYSKINEKNMKNYDNATRFEMGNKLSGNMNVHPSYQQTRNPSVVVKFLGSMSSDSVAQASGYPITRIVTMRRIYNKFSGMPKEQIKEEREALESLIGILKQINKK